MNFEPYCVGQQLSAMEEEEDCCSEAVSRDQARSSPHTDPRGTKDATKPLTLYINVRQIVTCHPREREEHVGKRQVLDCDSKGAGKFFAMLVLRNLVYGENVWQITIFWSNKHKSSKEKLALKEARERDIAKCLKAYDDMSLPNTCHVCNRVVII